MLVYLLLGQDLYPTDCEYNYLTFVVKLHSKPDDNAGHLGTILLKIHGDVKQTKNIMEQPERELKLDSALTII